MRFDNMGAGGEPYRTSAYGFVVKEPRDRGNGLRIFDDAAGVMNLSVVDIGGEALVVSQFTLMASTRKGNRPSYIAAAPHETAIPLYERFCGRLSVALGRPVATGVFGADMAVSLVNDGPVTICIDSKNP